MGLLFYHTEMFKFPASSDHDDDYYDIDNKKVGIKPWVKDHLFCHFDQ